MGAIVGLNALSKGDSLALDRPNIIVIMADDLGFSDIGPYGSEIETPHLDRLAREGMKFTQFYNCARCSPSRASLLTGLYPHRAGMGTLTNLSGKPDSPPYQGYLNDRCLTVAEALQRGGYQTLMSGKWHVGEERPHWPLDRGFEQYYGLIGGASHYFNPNLLQAGRTRGRVVARNNNQLIEFPDSFYLTDAISENAVAMLQEYGQQSDPFFLYVAYTAPHWPLHALPAETKKYIGKYLQGWDAVRTRRYRQAIARGAIDARWSLSLRDERVPSWETVENKAWEDMRMAVYAAQIEAMDRGIGQMLEALRQLGRDRETLVMFLSDNGASAEILADNQLDLMPGSGQTYMSYGIGWGNVSNTPFRRYKISVYEGGTATPFIAWWPGAIAPGSRNDRVGHVIDIMPTCLELAGVEYPESWDDRPLLPLDGKSLVPSFLGQTSEDHETLYWEHHNNRAIRQGQWKAVYEKETETWELYDLERDRTEMNNLAADYPERVAAMSEQWQVWAQEVGVDLSFEG